MRESLRKSGIDIIGDVPWGTHLCQFYQTKEDLMDILVPYFKSGLENNELCVWITSQPLEVEEAKEALRRAVPDFDVYLERGQMEIIPYTHGYMKEGIFDPERAVNSWVEKINQALARGYDGLRATGDNRWLEKEGWDDFVDYENKVDAIIDKHHVIALCPYYLDMCSTAEIIDVVSNHQFALIKREGKWERIENSGRKRAEKEAIQAANNWKYTFDAVPDLVAIIDDKYRVVRANRAMAARLGVTPEECVGLTCNRVIHGTDRPPSFCPHRQLLKDGAEHTAEVFEDYLGGYFVVSASPLYDSEGKLIGSVYVAHDINERKQEEHRISRYNLILEGINRIFSNVVQAKTEEELGNACLSVALEMTGSQFGFINEMGADGLLHDVAKSELGWEQCLMYDKTGHRRPPSDFVVHGLYGSVINNEKGFFTNDPPSHPDSIGLPYGHPPITSFLGVPLVQDGKTTGLIAVANREGGYSCEQQKDLETIAPAVVQALQRKRSEEALRFSNIYNRSLIEASLDPLVTIGHDGKITDVNGATEQVTGYSRNDLIGTDFSDYFTEPEKAHSGYQQVFTDGKVWDYPLELQHKDGHTIPVLYNASVYKDGAGKIIGVFAAARDITERKKAEKALKKAHDNLEKLVEKRTAELEKAYNSLKESEKGLAEAQKMAHIGNWDWDLVTGETYWSDELYRIYGRNLQEPGATFYELFNYVHPDDRDYVEQSIQKGLKEEPKNGIDYRIVLANGEERTVHSQAEVIFDEQKIPVRVKGIVQDITERKKSEEKIQTLANVVESSNDAIATESLDGIITSWNKSAEQMYGYSAEEILGKNVSILEPDTIKGEVKQLIEKIKQGKKIQHYETLRLKKDGTIINSSITLSPIFDSYGKLVAISGIARDITERIKAEKLLAKAEEARMKEIHHRIKNNLQVISSLLDLQAEKFRDKEVLEAFRESQNRVTSMSLIHEELYKGEGNDTLNFSAYLQKLAESLFQTYNLSSKNVRLCMDLEENTLFNMDVAVPLGIIVNELVSNSLKHAFTEKEEGEIRIKLCRKEKNNEIDKSLFSLTISDNGKGIPEHVELERSESLGLQLVSILVDQLDGKIELKRDQGTKFRITFRVAERS
ncbi:PAS domain S-box protein [Methanosarcina sp.]|uniref:PAS domain S-box protein n=1 Tax=Methanosarcina sp. TaxID=2213 RepID=UPI002AB7F6D7|nr:PAS domain S-box protein [Methanosarcina sp.]MDY9927074.1 PAS domain S-box protein [Methanosarcina sp.]